jgi:hypothetical protein
MLVSLLFFLERAFVPPNLLEDLGIRIMEFQNKTLLAKSGWKVHTNPNLHSQFLEALIKAGSSWLRNGIPNASLLPYLNVLDLILLEDHSWNAPLIQQIFVFCES